MEKARAVFIFPNGMIAVTNKNGEQIPELQGEKTAKLLEKIKKRSDKLTEWSW